METLRCKLYSNWLTQNVSNSGIGYLLSHMYEIGMIIPFSKQYRYVTSHLHLYVTNYYIFVCTISLLLLIMCLTLVNADISRNTTFTTIVIFGQINICSMDLFSYRYGGCFAKPLGPLGSFTEPFLEGALNTHIKMHTFQFFCLQMWGILAMLLGALRGFMKPLYRGVFVIP